MKSPQYYSLSSATAKTQGGSLPHWSQTCATFVTFRLADSLPTDKLAEFNFERERWLLQHPEPRNQTTMDEYRKLFPKRLQDWLDAGYGECILGEEQIRHIVEDSLRHFADIRYSLYAYVVMPNHVHVLFMPEEGMDGRRVIADWKRFTAKEINAARGTGGEIWQKESYDHLVRDVAEFNAIRAYIRRNAPTIAFDAYAK